MFVFFKSTTMIEHVESKIMSFVYKNALPLA